MIVQITMARNEQVLIEELLPIWKRYADGFVFLLDKNTDNTREYLESVREEYNILEILETNEPDSKLPIETDKRQVLFDTGRKYSNKIVCLDADEYLDGNMSKKDLELFLDKNQDTLVFLEWIQYTSANTIRVDGPWKYNLKDRVGVYSRSNKFVPAQMHSQHLPTPSNQLVLPREQLFIAHLQWLNKTHVAIKQYFWKVEDYVNNLKFGASVVGNSAYDNSVNNFEWEEEYTDLELKIKDDIFENMSLIDNYRVRIIQDRIKEHNIPNLGDWGYNITEYVPMYFCTAADDRHFPLLMNLIGSIHEHNFYETAQIRVYDLGMTEAQLHELKNIKRVVLCNVEKTNQDILNLIETGKNRSVRGLFSWKPVIIKDSLDACEYVLYLDAGTTILSPLNKLFKHIIQNNYLFFDCGHSIKWMTPTHVIEKFDLDSDELRWLLADDTFGIDAGFMGVSRVLYDDFVLPMYELSKNINNFYDDGSCPDGWGTGRHDQTLFSILARKLNLSLQYHGIGKESFLQVDGKSVFIHLTHTKNEVTNNTTIYRSRWDLQYTKFKKHVSAIKRKFLVTVITAIGDLGTYGKFLENYFSCITQQYMFNRIEFVIVYSEWSELFEKYQMFDNIKFIKENQKLGIYNAWNIGIINATSEFITNWNVDDLRMNVNNSFKYKLLSTDADVDLVYNYYVAVNESELTDLDISNKQYIQYPDNFHTVSTSMCMAGPDPMWRKSIHLFHGLFNYKDFSIIGDWEMWIRMAKNNMKFRLIPEVLCIYVDHNSTVSSNLVEAERQKQKLKQLYG